MNQNSETRLERKSYFIKIILLGILCIVILCATYLITIQIYINSPTIQISKNSITSTTTSISIHSNINSNQDLSIPLRHQLMNSHISDNINKVIYKRSIKKWSKQCGLVWFYHIAKTGGSNMRNIFIEHNFKIFEFWGGKGKINMDNRYDNELIPFIKRNILSNKKLFIHHHNYGYGLKKLIFSNKLFEIKTLVTEQYNCEFFIFTILRNPIPLQSSVMAFYGGKLRRDKMKLKDQLKPVIIPNYQIGYINYNFQYLKMDKTQILYDEMLNNSYHIISHFDLIGFNMEKHYAGVIESIFNIINISLNSSVLSWTNNVNKLRVGIPSKMLKNFIKTSDYDMKFWYDISYNITYE